jgi:predicted metal-binding membrane protein
MPMPGGWSMSMAWMRMPGQTWPVAAAWFLGMWIVMMVAMMLPSLVPMLAGYPRRRVVAGAAYFLVWTAFGAVLYPLGIALASAEMRWPSLARSVPLAAGVVLLGAGLVQLTPWKARQLGLCRTAAACATSRTAWQHGLHLGLHCALCCSGLMAVLIVLGVMDLRAMAIVAVAITTERVVPRPQLWARMTGVVILAVGVISLSS